MPRRKSWLRQTVEKLMEHAPGYCAGHYTDVMETHFGVDRAMTGRMVSAIKATRKKRAEKGAE